jgi:hypothetical protein
LPTPPQDLVCTGTASNTGVGLLGRRRVTVLGDEGTVLVEDNSFPAKSTEVRNTMRKHIKRSMRLALGVATLSGAGILGTLGAGAANAAP